MIKQWMLIFLLTLLARTVFAGAICPEPIWPENSGSRNTEKVENRAKTGLNRAIREVEIPGFDISRPDSARHSDLAVIICPGGGFKYITVDKEGFDVARRLQQHGVTSIVLKYRTGNRQKALADLQRTIRLIRHNAKKLGIHPDKIGVIGFSAGGNLAARSTLTFDPGAPDAADPVERESSRPDFVGLIYPYQIPENIEELTRSDAPPAFLVHASDDPISPENSVRYCQAALRHGVPVEARIYASGGHGFGVNRAQAPRAAAWDREFIEWLKELKFLPQSGNNK